MKLVAVYLNTNKCLENYKRLFKMDYFVDKSTIIEKSNNVINKANNYLCITRPRRFGKSSVADMLGAYYSKAVDSKDIFDSLKISKSDSYDEHLNKYNVININFNKIPDKNKTYDEYIGLLQSGLIGDIKSIYPDLEIKDYYTISDMLAATNEKFIFIFDEWDYIFNNNLFTENQNEYLEFLRNLLKDQPYVALAYMTGVLPIKKFTSFISPTNNLCSAADYCVAQRYSSGSALNMFDEYTMLNDMIYGDYFGFTEEEVIELCKRQDAISFDDISDWYNGYTTEEGTRIYNPRSVVKALQNRKCTSYWTNTGAMDEVEEYLKYNTLEIRDDVIAMVSKEEIDITIDEEFRAGQGIPKTKEEIYSAMIVLGFLSYYDGYLKIPNKELMKEFQKALKDESFGYVSKIIENSRKMLKSTLNGDAKVVEDILHDIHNAEIPILKYSDENSLSCVLTLAYLSARDTYRVEREEKSGKGYTDFSFHPRRKNDIPFIVELKKNNTPENAIKQIRDKEYVQKFRNEFNDKKVLAVAICYDSNTKEHSCIIEEI